MDNFKQIPDNFGQISPVFDHLFKGYDLGNELCLFLSFFRLERRTKSEIFLL